MTLRIDVTHDAGSTTNVRRLIDGQPAPEGQSMQMSEAVSIAWPAVWIDGERQYDVRVYFNGQLRFYIPPKAPEVERSYEEHEYARRLISPPDTPPEEPGS